MSPHGVPGIGLGGRREPPPPGSAESDAGHGRRCQGSCAKLVPGSRGSDRARHSTVRPGDGGGGDSSHDHDCTSQEGRRRVCGSPSAAHVAHLRLLGLPRFRPRVNRQPSQDPDLPWGPTSGMPGSAGSRRRPATPVRGEINGSPVLESCRSGPTAPLTRRSLMSMPSNRVSPVQALLIACVARSWRCPERLSRPASSRTRAMPTGPTSPLARSTPTGSRAGRPSRSRSRAHRRARNCRARRARWTSGDA